MLKQFCVGCVADVPEDGSQPSILELEHRPVVGFKADGEDNFVIGKFVDKTKLCHFCNAIV